MCSDIVRPIRPVETHSLDRFRAAMRPGDIILKFGTDKVAAVIGYVQGRYGYCPDARKTSHVAMYCGGGQVFHATYSPLKPENSRARFDDFETAFLGHRITVIRSDIAGDPDRCNELIEAARTLGGPYGVTAAVDLLIDASFGKVIADTLGADYSERYRLKILRDTRTAPICSSLVFQVYLRAWRQDTPLDAPETGGSAPVSMPADFYINPRLTNVKI
ncbi:hypothetical protein AL036_12595 [Salipiger aestuarii]|uniref:Permuted papain-like amidase YaeF/Yiix C92 family enzyme n=1 Tax=Salipiger aestuarii TaxID=568098 RepID=A0A327Y0A2_9RHOB|nr:hypothetical protein [Salipiger aestuarii]KAA8606908.1 hypothetical protein AL036_12595 [Salipiger aestuarii]RAK14214.1 hypothetical protein ATI53_102815 [Salipiger aestuarii]